MYRKMGTSRMNPRDFTIVFMLLSQTILGILGNFGLLYHYKIFYFNGYRIRSTDLILKQLTIANSLAIATKGILQIMTAFGLQNFLNDFGCKFIFYIHMVSMGLSISTTCFLSIFQAIKISQRNFRWAELQVQAHKCTGPSLNLCWILYMLVNIIFPLYVTGKWNNKNITMKKDLGYCSGVGNTKITQSLLAALLICPNVVCLGLMIWDSGSMVFILYRHKKQILHIHRNNVSPRSSPENRATQSTLFLVSIFIPFYAPSCLFSFYLALFDNPRLWLLNTCVLIVSCFPTVSPFLLWGRDFRLPRLCSACYRRNT